MPQLIQLTINGARCEVAAEPERSLLVVLREELGLTGAKYGCAVGACGACTVLVDGVPARACITPPGEVAGAAVTTIEGLTRGGQPHPVQTALVGAAATQCGYCTPGMVLAAAALLAAHPDPGDDQIVRALDGNVCRCCAYPRIMTAVRRAAAHAAPTQDSPASGGADDQAPERLPHTGTLSAYAAGFVASSSQAGAAGGSGGSPPRASAAGGSGGSPPRASTAGGSGGSPPRASTAPWDLLPPGERGYFDVLPDGLVSVLPPEEARTGRPGPWRANGGAWVHVGADGTVTAFTGKVDVGQDNRTALSLLVAEELSVPAQAVAMVMGDTDVCPYDIGTFGSRSMPDAGQALQAAAAAARQALIAMAATGWEVDLGELSASDGAVKDHSSGASVSYAELLRGVRRTVTATADAPVKDRRTWRTAGQPTRKPESRLAVTGAKQFTSDLMLPGMLHGKILRPPRYGATLRSADLSRARGVPDVIAVHNGSFAGVAGPDPVTAAHALQLVEAEWDYVAQPPEGDLVAHLRSHPRHVEGWGGRFDHETGDVSAALADADNRLAATYTTAYIAHVPLEPRVALAEWRDGRLTVWTGTQRPFGVRLELAEMLGVPETAVRVIVPGTGSGFGGKHAGPVAAEAARLARAAGRPVKVQWSREEEFTWGYFRPAAVIDVASGTSDDGVLHAFEFINLNAGAAGILTPYEVPDQRIVFQPAASPLPQGSYRALAATANNFARESHMDEVAHQLGADPLEFRLRHLRDERLAAVLRAAAERGGWPAGGPDRGGAAGARAAGGPDRGRAGGHGLGIACGAEKDGRVATCAEVSVGEDGTLQIHRIVTAYECGSAVNPDNVVNQIEGATVMALGGALFEAVHFDDGVILNASLAHYRVPRFSDVPPIDVVLLDRRDIPPAGAGETPMIAVAPAVANAIFAATGQRLRSLPLLPEGRLPR
jgi:CO/xanthine dehydrogenase Mo-binding subunit/aerobic-type carbon monoxide dehydrogenase small subunit (CoxS/CutS family)